MSGSHPATKRLRGTRLDEAREAWLLPGLVAVAAALLMVIVAVAVHIPRVEAGMKPRSGSVPDLIVTRLAQLPVDGEVREYLRLSDPARLFFPASESLESGGAGEGVVEQPGAGVADGFPAAFVFQERPSRDILRPTPPRSPVAGMDAVTRHRWFAGMAREGGPVDTGPSKLAALGEARMDVYQSGSAERMASIPLPDDDLLATTVWGPIRLSVLVDVAGTVASPIVISGSGLGEVDERVRSLVARELLPRLRLRPGVYRLVVGP